MSNTTEDNQRAGPVKGSTRVSDTEIETARGEITRAFQILGLASGGNPVCPECGASEKGKVKLFEDGGWHCYKRGHHGYRNGAVDLLVNYGGYQFLDAVNLLLGKPVGAKSSYVAPKELPQLDDAKDFKATVDIEVYDEVRRQADVEAAVLFYQRWHISENAVRETGACVALNPAKLMSDLVEKFTLQRVVDCGLIKPKEDTAHGKDFALLNAQYPIIEPYLRPDGHVVGMQFRASFEHSLKVKAYPKAKQAYEKAKADWEKTHGENTYTKPAVRFLPKFLSLRGAGEDSLIGCGLWRVSRLEPGQRVHIVEGPKDLMAARTLGVEAYAVSGVGDMPSAKVCRILARHTAVIRMDGDDAGREGAVRLGEHFEKHNVPFEQKALPDGMDVTDILVQRHSSQGCECPVCQDWRKHQR